MGVEYRGVICVGYDYNQLTEIEGFYDGNFYEFCEDKGLNSFSPYYDADSADCIYGRVVAASPDYGFKEIGNLDELIAEAIDNLTKEFGVIPKAYLMADGW